MLQINVLMEKIVKSIVIKQDKVYSRMESNNVYPKDFISVENTGLTKMYNEGGKAKLLVSLVEGGLSGYLKFVHYCQILQQPLVYYHLFQAE